MAKKWTIEAVDGAGKRRAYYVHAPDRRSAESALAQLGLTVVEELPRDDGPTNVPGWQKAVSVVFAVILAAVVSLWVRSCFRSTTRPNVPPPTWRQ